MRLKRKDILDIAILICMLLQIIVIRWLHQSFRWVYIVDGLLVLRIVTKMKYFTKKKSFYIAVVIGLYSVINYKVLLGSYSVLKNNYKYFFCFILAVMFFEYLYEMKFDLLKNFLLKLSFLLNAYYFMNIFALLEEKKGNYFWSGINGGAVGRVFHADMLSGLLGFYGTPVLGMFTTFMLVYNLYLTFNMQNSKKKFYLKLYNYLMLLFMIWISFYNENKGFFIVLAISFFLFLGISRYIADGVDIRSKTINSLYSNLKYFIYLGAFIGIGFVLIFSIPTTRKIVMEYYSIAVSGFVAGKTAVGTQQRFGILDFFFSNKEHIWMGYGMGKIGWREEMALGFRQFGQSDLGSILCLGGLIFVLLIFVYFLNLIKNSLKSNVLVGIVMVLFSYLLMYTQIITDYSSLFIFLFMISIFKIYIGSDVKQKNGE